MDDFEFFFVVEDVEGYLFFHSDDYDGARCRIIEVFCEALFGLLIALTHFFLFLAHLFLCNWLTYNLGTVIEKLGQLVEEQ